MSPATRCCCSRFAHLMLLMLAAQHPHFTHMHTRHPLWLWAGRLNAVWDTGSERGAAHSHWGVGFSLVVCRHLSCRLLLYILGSGHGQFEESSSTHPPTPTMFVCCVCVLCVVWVGVCVWCQMYVGAYCSSCDGATSLLKNISQFLFIWSFIQSLGTAEQYCIFLAWY